MALNLNAMRKEWRKDGFLILKTNAPALSDVEVAQAYRTLWHVENAFRHIKDRSRLVWTSVVRFDGACLSDEICVATRSREYMEIRPDR